MIRLFDDDVNCYEDVHEDIKTAKQAEERIEHKLKEIREFLPVDDARFQSDWFHDQKYSYRTIFYLMARFRKVLLGDKAIFTKIMNKVSDSITFSFDCQKKAREMMLKRKQMK